MMILLKIKHWNSKGQKQLVDKGKCLYHGKIIQEPLDIFITISSKLF